MADATDDANDLHVIPQPADSSFTNASPTNASNSSPTTSNKRKRPSSPPHASNPAPSRDSDVEAAPATTAEQQQALHTTTALPLPDEPIPPPLPDEPLPGAGSQAEAQSRQPQQALSDDDGWQPVWDASAQTYYFYNRFTQATQWENPRVPEVSAAATNHDRIDSGVAPGTQPQLQQPGTRLSDAPPPRRTGTGAAGGYNPAIHGDYDPNADYAQLPNADDDPSQQPPHPLLLNPDGTPADPSLSADPYAASAAFNRFTGRFQAGELKPENFNDENKARRQMSAFFDVDAAANTHDGKSLRKERQERKLTREEVKAFKEKRKERKEQKKRAWLMD